MASPLAQSSTLTYQVESWETLWPDLEPLLNTEHGPEATWMPDALPVDLDPKFYAAVAAAGCLDCVTVRDAGALVGYHVSLITPAHIHFRTVCSATVTLYFLRQAYRGRGVGKAMFHFAEGRLRERGVQLAFVGAKRYLPYEALFERLGWFPAETQFMKWLGDPL